jgi:hypothetical protein
MQDMTAAWAEYSDLYNKFDETKRTVSAWDQTQVVAHLFGANVDYHFDANVTTVTPGVPQTVCSAAGTSRCSKPAHNCEVF